MWRERICNSNNTTHRLNLQWSPWPKFRNCWQRRIGHPQYAPDMVPSDFLFLVFKMFSWRTEKFIEQRNRSSHTRPFADQAANYYLDGLIRSFGKTWPYRKNCSTKLPVPFQAQKFLYYPLPSLHSCWNSIKCSVRLEIILV